MGHTENPQHKIWDKFCELYGFLYEKNKKIIRTAPVISSKNRHVFLKKSIGNNILGSL